MNSKINSKGKSIVLILIQKLIILVLNLCALFGIELFHYTERINNRRSEFFLSKFVDSETNNNFIVNEFLVRNLFIKRFGRNRLDDEFLEYLIEVYIKRLSGVPLKKTNSELNILNNQFNRKTLKVKDYFLLSKFLSKLGRFVLANRIDDMIKSIVMTMEFHSIYSLFQTIKFKLYYNTQSLETYLEDYSLTNYFNKFYLINTLLDKVNFSLRSNEGYLKVLGPLRENFSTDISKNSRFALIKPNINEINILNNLEFNHCYLYSYEPLKNILDISNRVLNVIDYHSKSNDKSVLNMNYYTQFLLINGYPQHLQRVLIHQIFQTPNIYFSLDYVSFYLSDKQYSENYLYPNKKISDKTKIEIHSFIWWNGWHELLANYRFCKFLNENKLFVKNSESVNELINLTVEQYAQEMEIFYEF